jgi:hypothetical protein
MAVPDREGGSHEDRIILAWSAGLYLVSFSFPMLDIASDRAYLDSKYHTVLASVTLERST